MITVPTLRRREQHLRRSAQRQQPEASVTNFNNRNTTPTPDHPTGQAVAIPPGWVLTQGLALSDASSGPAVRDSQNSPTSSEQTEVDR